MIVDSTACWEFADRYAGEKYIAWPSGYSNAEKYAHERGNNIYETGGSITTLALEVVLRLGAKAVYLVGVDLAYPGGVSHAEGIMDRMVRDTSGMTKVKSVNGDWGYADTLFIKYRQWIEGKLAEYSDAIGGYTAIICRFRGNGCYKIFANALPYFGLCAKTKPKHNTF